MRRALCIWIPDWPLQRLALARPELHGRTVVLYEATPQGGLKVVGATAALGLGEDARSFAAGIYPGMPLAEAVALVTHSPHLEPADPQADLLALEQLAEWCHRFSPIAGIEEAARPECLLLDVTGLAALFGGEPALGDQVARAMAEWGLNVRVAIAGTIGAAWAAVHAERWDEEPIAPKGPNRSSRERSSRYRTTGIPDPEGVTPSEGLTPSGSMSNISSGSGGVAAGYWSATPPALVQEKQSPPSVRLLPPGGTLAALAPLPIGYLRVADNTVALLATLGITRIGQLAALPRSALLSRFGPELLWRLDQATGGAPETILARHAPPEYTADFTFEAPMGRREVIEEALGELLARITEPLARRREGVLRLVCRLKYERAFDEDAANDRHSPFSLAQAFMPGITGNHSILDAPLGAKAPAIKNRHADPGVNAWATEKTPSFSFTLGLFRPSASPEYLRDLLRLRLESVRMPGPVTSVHVEATAVGPLELRQQAIFDSDTDHERPRRLAGLVDRLSNRLGRNTVAQVALLPDAQPEYTCVDVPLADGVTSMKLPTRQTATKRTKKNLTHVTRYGLLSFAADERPLWLLAQPVRIEVVAAARGAPAKFHWAGRSYAIAFTWGPERIETGWWRTASRDQESRKTFIRRDYYRVETSSGARFWIFRSMSDRQWFLQGAFD